jgi:hypothetical protein
MAKILRTFEHGPSSRRRCIATAHLGHRMCSNFRMLKRPRPTDNEVLVRVSAERQSGRLFPVASWPLMDRQTFCEDLTITDELEIKACASS